MILNIFIERAEVTDEQMVQNYAQFPKQLQLLNREISRIDLGIKEVHVAQGSGGPSSSLSTTISPCRCPCIMRAQARVTSLNSFR